MTAEIAILNKSAVALAADSKVTLSRDGKQKTYDTVDKLFSLSKSEPVGAMIYGNAEFMGFPWETLVKEYRRQNPDKCFDTVFEWAEDFRHYLVSFFPFTEDDENGSALGVASAWIQHIIEIAFASTSNSEDFEEAVLNEASQVLDMLASASDFLTDEEWNSLRPRISGALDAMGSENSFGKKALQERLVHLAEAAIRKLHPSPATSGLVLAGFGDRELLPSLDACEIDGILFGRLRTFETKKFDATRTKQGIIRPFAQSDMVYRFMEGIDPDYAVQLHQDVGKLLIHNILDAAAALGHSPEEIEEITPALQTATTAALETFWKTHTRIRREQFASPIIDMAMSLPKDELANLAESLVSLTSLQRRVSRDIETVGGAIDVAVISKGDGFVWIKRKHYFQADRNLRFVNGYFNEFGKTAGRHKNGDHDAKP